MNITVNVNDPNTDEVQAIVAGLNFVKEGFLNAPETMNYDVVIDRVVKGDEVLENHPDALLTLTGVGVLDFGDETLPIVRVSRREYEVVPN